MATQPKVKKPTTCAACQETGLSWSFNHATHKKMLISVDQYGVKYPHDCKQNDIKEAGRCIYCKAPNLFWVKKTDELRRAFGYKSNDKFELTESYGLPHFCDEYKAMRLAVKEARREDYAWEKKHLASIPDDTICTRCLGNGSGRRKSGARVIMMFGKRYKPCKKCRGIGVFSALKKKDFLKALRRKYWPWAAWQKWKARP